MYPDEDDTMRAFKRLKGLFRSDRGNALMIAAGAMPVIMASAGFAVDTIYLSVLKRQMQRAADSSALAGAYALSQEASPDNAVTRDLTRNKFPALAGAQQVTVAPSLGYQKTVRVQLRTTPHLPFSTMFTKSRATITSDATAAIVEGGEFCVLSLYNGTAPGVDIGGNATLNLGCGLAANSTGSNAIHAFGSSAVTASPIMAVGGLNGSTNYNGTTKLQPHAAEQTDPFAGVPDPVLPTNCGGKLQVKHNDPPPVFTTKCFSEIDIDGAVALPPGTYYVNGGDLSFGSQAKVVGTGVTFVMTGPGGAAGDLNMNGQANLNLTAPTSGDFKDILFYRDRRATNIDIKINGGADMLFKGALYFPSSDVTFTGNAGFSATCFQMVGQILTFRGNATINNSCSDYGDLPTFRLKFVRLVQ
jgi:Flp pilus assembly protein TadG